MAFYRFHVCDPVNRIDGHGHDGASLADDIDATLFAAGMIQRLVQERPSVPRSWAIEITQDARQVSALSFEAGLQVLLRPNWACER
jgi:phosphoheptose isomerase